MAFAELEPVVLAVDRAEGLKKGLLGTVVEVISPKRVLVEFVTASGRTIALVPLDVRELRKPTDADALAVSPAGKRKAEVIGPIRPAKTPKAAGAGSRITKARARHRRSTSVTTLRWRTA